MVDAVRNLLTINCPLSGTINLSYDALNRMTNMVDGIGTTKYTYTAAGQLLTEDGPFPGDTVTNAYWNRSRTNLSLQQPTGIWTNAFAYDSTKRLTNVTSPAGAFGYVYDPTLFTHHGSLVTLPNTSYITNAFDGNARLIATYLNKSDNSTFDSYIYAYNPANERTHLTRADSSTVGYNYDGIGQLTNADSSVSSEDRGYAYDSAWNLNYRTNNGSLSTFIVDNKNELTNAFGTAYAYDSNGNLSSGNAAHNFYDYDDENRLIQWFFYHIGGGVASTVGDLRTDLVYDGLGRLRKRIDFAWQTSGGGAGPRPPANPTWVATNTVLYIYDGWRVIQERDTNNVPTVSYTRGNDLSASMEGAGGIGGMLARSSGYSGGNWATHNYYFADGNGNIAYMLNSSQAMVASYRYDPFGNTISSSGTLASANRFSSKEIHVNSGMYHYGYRFYDPNLQRWINRDPISERGFRTVVKQAKMHTAVEENTLYVAFSNDPLNKYDAFGLSIVNPFAYGNWCGPRSGPSPPIDEVDAACKKHDYCLATWKEFINPCKQFSCNRDFCNSIRKADCSKSPNPSECRQEKGEIMATCALFSGGGTIWTW
jgi:RHS repeat-associated protein